MREGKYWHSLRHLFATCALALFLSGCGSSSDEINYVAIGASDATGVGAIPPTRGYVFEIDDGLDNRCGGAELFNLGIPGVEADQIEDSEVPAATELDPDLITIWTGANDLVAGRSVDSFQSDLVNILMTLSDDTDAAIFIANLPDLTMLPRFEDDPDPDVSSERVMAFNTVIESEAQAVGVRLVDLSTIPLNNVLVSEDGFHPSEEGHATIAQAFLMEIIPTICS